MKFILSLDFRQKESPCFESLVHEFLLHAYGVIEAKIMSEKFGIGQAKILGVRFLLRLKHFFIAVCCHFVSAGKSRIQKNEFKLSLRIDILLHDI